jgi:ribosomal protein L7/L12
MNLISLLDVFIDLVLGSIPTKLRKPIGVIAEEIRDGVTNLDGEVARWANNNRNLQHDLDSIQNALEATREELQEIRDKFIAQYASNSRMAQFAQSLVKNERIEYSDELIVSSVRDCYNTRGKIEAVKLFRSITGMGLKESKETVEKWIELGF